MNLVFPSQESPGLKFKGSREIISRAGELNSIQRRFLGKGSIFVERGIKLKTWHLIRSKKEMGVQSEENRS